MSYSIKGVITEVFPLVHVSDKFRKQEFVLETSETNGSNTYTEHIKFEITQNNTDLLSQFGEGDEVVVDFNLRGRKYEKGGETRYFNSIVAWKIAGASNAPQPKKESKTVKETAPVDDLEYDDQLPF